MSNPGLRPQSSAFSHSFVFLFTLAPSNRALPWLDLLVDNLLLLLQPRSPTSKPPIEAPDRNHAAVRVPMNSATNSSLHPGPRVRYHGDPLLCSNSDSPTGHPLRRYNLTSDPPPSSRAKPISSWSTSALTLPWPYYCWCCLFSLFCLFSFIIVILFYYLL